MRQDTIIIVTISVCIYISITSNAYANFINCIESKVPIYDDGITSAEVIAEVVKEECYKVIDREVTSKFGEISPSNGKALYNYSMYNKVAKEQAIKFILRNRVIKRSGSNNTKPSSSPKVNRQAVDDLPGE